MDLDKFLAALDELESFGQGGGGFIGKFRFDVAFFIYSGEVDGDEKAYPFKPGDQDSMQQALANANEAMAKHGLDELTGKDKQKVGPHPSYVTTFYKANAKGATAVRAEGWQDDRNFAVPMWSDAAKELWRPAIKELALMPGEYWGRITFGEDPSGRMEQGLDGPRVALVAYPAELYANEAEAEEAAGGDENESAGSSSSLSPKLTKAVKGDYEAATAAGKSPLKAAKEVAEDWEITVDEVLAIVE